MGLEYHVTSLDDMAAYFRARADLCGQAAQGATARAIVQRWEIAAATWREAADFVAATRLVPSGDGGADDAG